MSIRREGAVSGRRDRMVSGMETSGTWWPGRREALVVFALAMLGLASWAVGTPVVAGKLLGDTFYRAAYGFPFYSGTPLYALLSLAAGFLFPRGCFYLWGAAILVLQPFAGATLLASQESRGIHILQDGAGAQVAYALTLVMMAFGLAFIATLLSTAGAGIRLLLRCLL
jgi:hypothetical protein